MKKKLLLMMMCAPALLAAQNGNGVTVSDLVVDAETVSFNVSWNRDAMPDVWSDTVWVFVDYNKNGVMERLPVTSATVSAGTVTKIPSNDKGVWVVGNARDAGSFSATVRLFTSVSNVAGACAYASNYPPVGEYSSDAPILSFTGTPMYDIQLTYSGGENATVKAGDTFLLPCNYTVTSFTDATGAQGRLNGVPFNDNASVPRYAVSAKTWPVGSQVWSDYINIPECDHVTYTNSNTDPYCRSNTANEKKWYYYNWAYVNKNQKTLCPEQWRVPTKDDFVALDKALGGTGDARSGVDQKWLTDHYITAWGGTYGIGFATGSSVLDVGSNTFISAITEISTEAYMLYLSQSGYISPVWYWSKSGGFPIRCVKNY
jgi:uncharacterized protein (TIGR02145 family)